LAAAELVALAPDVIVVQSNLALAALREHTRTIPIVFAAVSDPVASGFVASLSRPGGNVTGFTQFEPEMGSKWLEMLKEIAPRVERVVFLFHPDIRANLGFVQTAEQASKALGISVIRAPVRSSEDIEAVLTSRSAEPGSAVIVAPNPVHQRNRERIIGLTSRHRLPAIYPYRYFAASGGLLSYGIDNLLLSRQAASYVDRILKGTSPGDLPVQRPTKFELYINLKTAKALGLTVSQTLLVAADELIE
jgi:putative tryptophan/tyrosine transport system substrate-binding protein